MKFAYPEFLYALFAIAIPIIIHLFNFRKFKKIYFSNVEFLKEVQQETQSKSKLKHLLILLSRILAITFLVFAFAQPFIPANESSVANQNNVVGIYIDNSFSMESVGQTGNLLDEAKLKAIEIIKTYKPTDKFILTNNSFSAGDQRLLTNEEIIDKIEEITISPRTKLLSEVYSRTRNALNSSEIINKSFYSISDFQKTVSDFAAISADTLIDTYIIPIKANQSNNLYIDSCWFESPTHLLFHQEQLKVVIRNDSENDLENIPIKLYINKQVVVPASASIKAHDKNVVTLTYQNKSNGIQNGKIEVRDSPVTTDDAFYFSYKISENIDILSITNNKKNSSLASIYRTDSIFNFSEFDVNQLDYSLIKSSNLIIINNLDKINSGLSNALKSFTDNGGSLLIFPSNNINVDSYREFMSLLNVNYYTSIDTVKTKVGEINYSHPIYKNVFDGKPESNLNLPKVTSHYKISTNNTAFKNNLLSFKNGNTFLSDYKVEKGSIYISSVGLNQTFSNFTNHALFVPTLYNIALLSQINYPLFHIIGSNSAIDINNVEKDNTYHIKNENFDIIPKIRKKNNNTTIFINSGIDEAGNYTLENENTNIGLAFNYDRLESKLSCYTPVELEEQININTLNAQIIEIENNTIKSALSEMNIGKRYWKYCIILALFFLAVEIILIKIFKQ
jgi:Aerotolerance regulator N-terminal